MAETRRLFLAIDIPETWREELSKYQLELKKLYPQLRLTPPRNFHITLTFYGNSTSEETTALIQELSKTFKHFQAFIIQGDTFGYFFNRERTVFWYGAVSATLGKLTEKTSELIKEEKYTKGFQGHKKEDFKAHITLGRINNKKVHLKDFNPEIKLSEFKAETIILYESVLAPDGPIYNKVFEWQI